MKFNHISHKIIWFLLLKCNIILLFDLSYKNSIIMIYTPYHLYLISFMAFSIPLT